MEEEPAGASREDKTMALRVPTLTTRRLQIRELDHHDLAAVTVLLSETEDAATKTVEEWLRWTVAGYAQHDRLSQPPYGERAVILSSTGTLIGLAGYVPSFDEFGRLPAWGRETLAQEDRARRLPHFGLFWQIAVGHRGQGFATEAGEALIRHAFASLELQRIIATTVHDNLASQAVMGKLGMTLQVNPDPIHPWLQVVGFLDAP